MVTIPCVFGKYRSKSSWSSGMHRLPWLLYSHLCSQEILSSLV